MTNRTIQPDDERASMTWLRRVAELRTLAGKRDDLGYELALDEAARLDTLESFFFEEGEGDADRLPFADRASRRVPVALVVTFHGAEGPIAGTLRNVTGEGGFVETEAPLPVGTRTTLRVIDRLTGEELHFAAGVVRARTGGMGLRFAGIPLALRLGHRPAPTHGRRAA